MMHSLKQKCYVYFERRLLSLIGGDGFGSPISQLLQWSLNMMLSHLSDFCCAPNAFAAFQISNQVLGAPIYRETRKLLRYLHLIIHISMV